MEAPSPANLRRLAVLAAVTAATLSALPFFAQASLEPGEDRIIAYQGFLERDGAPVSGTMDLRFALSASDTTSFDCLVTADYEEVPLPECGIWWEEQEGVKLSAGRFAVELGARTALSDAVFAQPDLFLAVAVRDEGAGAFTLLPGRQRLRATAFANRAVAAHDFTVSGNLTVDGHTFVNSQSVLSTLTVDEHLMVDADGNPLKLSGQWSGHPDAVAEGAEIANDTTTYKTLMIVGNRSDDGVTRSVSVWDELNVNGDLNVTGEVSGLTVETANCHWVEDQWEIAGDGQRGQLRYLDRMNNLSCPANEVLVDWNVDALQSGNEYYKMKFLCCALTVR